MSGLSRCQLQGVEPQGSPRISPPEQDPVSSAARRGTVDVGGSADNGVPDQAFVEAAS